MERGRIADRSLPVLPVLTQHLAGAIHTAAKVIFRVQMCSHHSPVSDPQQLPAALRPKTNILGYPTKSRGLASVHLSSLVSYVSPLLPASRHIGCLSGHLSSCPRANGCCSLCLGGPSSTHFTELAATNASDLNPDVSALGKVFLESLVQVMQTCHIIAHGSLYSSSIALSKSTIVYLFGILF